MAKAKKKARPPFGAIHRHGFVRVAAASPRASTGDVAFNVDGDAEAGAARPTRAASTSPSSPSSTSPPTRSTTCCCRTPSSTRSRPGSRRLAAESAKLKTGARRRRAAAAQRPALQLRRWPSRAAASSAWCRRAFLPNYREYYEKRWFASGVGLDGLKIEVAGQSVPFGTDLVFAADDLADFVFHIEICEDYWAPQPPSTLGALAGALILTNLSASNITIGKADERKLLCAAPGEPLHRRPTSSPPPGRARARPTSPGTARARSTSSANCSPRPGGSTGARSWRVADIDVQRLRLERMRNGTFNDNARAAGHPETRFRRIGFEHEPGIRRHRLRAEAAPLPLRPQPARAARSGLLRGVQHPGPGPRRAASRRPAASISSSASRAGSIRPTP